MRSLLAYHIQLRLELEQLRRIQHQTAQIADGQLLRGLTELGLSQQDLFAALGLPMPTPDGVAPASSQAYPAISS